MKDFWFIATVVFIIIITLYVSTKESFTSESFDALTDSIRARQRFATRTQTGGAGSAAKIDRNVAQVGQSCSPFQLPDMYVPKGDCSDPFSWGFLYSTGPNPHVYSDRPKPKVGN